MEEFESLGSWWLPSNPEQQVTGTIKFSFEKGISFKIVGSLNELDFCNIGLQRLEIINGATHGQLFTLIDCTQNNNRSSFYITTKNYDVRYAFLGYHFKNLEEIKFDKFEVNFTDLKYFFPLFSNFNINYNSDQTYQEYQVSFSTFKNLKANISQADISVNQFIQQQATNQEMTVNNTALITVDIKYKKSLDEIFDQFITPIKNFITLSANRVNYITELNFILDTLDVSDTLEILDPNDLPRKVKAIFRITNYQNKTDILHIHEVLLNLDDIKDNFSLIMQKWFNLFDEQKDLINLYFSTIYNPNLYLENQFSSLVQTLESYHRRKIDKHNSYTKEHEIRLNNILAVTPIEYKDWLTEKLQFSHEPTLLERLKELFTLTNKTLNPLIINSDSFAKKIKNIRNYLTHYNDPSQQKQYDPEMLFRINQILTFIIKSCLLRELGCSPEFCQTLICRSPEYQFLETIRSENHKMFL